MNYVKFFPKFCYPNKYNKTVFTRFLGVYFILTITVCVTYIHTCIYIYICGFWKKLESALENIFAKLKIQVRLRSKAIMKVSFVVVSFKKHC